MKIVTPAQEKNMLEALEVLSAAHNDWLSISLLGENMSMAADVRAVQKRTPTTSDHICEPITIET